MTPEQFEEQMIELSQEVEEDERHEKMDKLMADLLSNLGYEAGIEVFKYTSKGYLY